MLSLERLYAIPYLDSEYPFDISPDGEQVAFVSNQSKRWEIYELALGQPRGAPARRGPGTGGSFAPRYAPDGSRLAWAMDLEGGERYHLLALERATGALTDLTPDLPCSLLPDFAWSPDGAQIALLADRDGCFDAYTMPAQGGPLTKVLSTGHPCWMVEWSPDGGWLAVGAFGRGLERYIYLVRPGGGEAHAIGGGLEAQHPAWSPDGLRLAFSSQADGFSRIGVLELSSASIRWLPGSEGEYEHPAWLPDGKQIVCTRGAGGRTGLAILPLDGAGEVRLDTPGVHAQPRFTPDGKYVLHLFDNAAQPTNLWRWDPASGQTWPLTASLPPDLSPADFPLPEHITYPGLDGRPVPAQLFRPLRTPAPALVLIHGGPNWLFENLWYPFTAHCASRGWAVLEPNYRGSTGYGRAWENASRFDYGGVDTDDCAAGGQYLIAQGIADPARLAVSGRSHGGYLTMTCLTRYPELWVAGAAVVPFIDWFNSHERSRADLQSWNIENMGDPVTYHDRWRAASPYFFLEQVRAPVQLICGALDPRCPAEDSLQARDRLLVLGKSVELVMYEDEGHAFLKRENIIDAELRRVEFLAQVLERK